jgi:hypothetical protein
MSVLTYYVAGVSNILSRIVTLQNKLNIDLQVTVPLVSVVYNNLTQQIIITYSGVLTDFQKLTVENIVGIIIFDKVLGVDVFIVDINATLRNSYIVASDPTPNHDNLSGYSQGSVVINTATNKIFVCENNTTGNAVWNQVYSAFGGINVNVSVVPLNNVSQYSVIKANAATGSGTVIMAQANNSTNASAVIGVAQFATNSGTGQVNTSAVVSGGTWINFDAAPTTGSIAYLSNLTAGNATITVPPVSGTAVKLRLGKVLRVNGNLGFVILNIDNLPRVADGLP